MERPYAATPGRRDPIGQRIQSWRDERLLRVIVGVVGEVRYTGLGDRGPFRQVYVPHPQNTWGFMNVVLRTARGAPADLTPLLRREVAGLDGDLAIANVQTLSEIAHDSITAERSTTVVLSVLAITALLLGAIGLYGVIAYAATERRGEVATRLALGATRGTVFWLMMRRGRTLALIGAVIGLASAYIGGRVIASKLYQVSASDPWILGAATVIVALIALGATIIPAFRSSRLDPVNVLRPE